jgi:hypothetical protein
VVNGLGLDSVVGSEDLKRYTIDIDNEEVGAKGSITFESVIILLSV